MRRSRIVERRIVDCQSGIRPQVPGRSPAATCRQPPEFRGKMVCSGKRLFVMIALGVAGVVNPAPSPCHESHTTAFVLKSSYFEDGMNLLNFPMTWNIGPLSLLQPHCQ